MHSVVPMNGSPCSSYSGCPGRRVLTGAQCAGDGVMMMMTTATTATTDEYKSTGLRMRASISIVDIAVWRNELY